MLPALVGPPVSRLDPDALASAAVEALSEEAQLTPKPGLVDAAGRGAHDDMDLVALLTSAEALRWSFRAVAASAVAAPVGVELREELGRIGRKGETAMLAATGGINTHRGALWAVGLLVAGVASAPGAGAGGAARVAARLAQLPDQFAPARRDSHGARAVRAYHARGAAEEAQAGFPHVTDVALPALRRGLLDGDSRHAALDALLAVMSTLDDTCVLHRGGRRGLATVQIGARHVLEARGSRTPEGAQRLRQLDADLTAARISPGGSADVLSAALFLLRVTESHQPGHAARPAPVPARSNGPWNY